jgi:hypothetical protein
MMVPKDLDAFEVKEIINRPLMIKYSTGVFWIPIYTASWKREVVTIFTRLLDKRVYQQDQLSTKKYILNVSLLVFTLSADD